MPAVSKSRRQPWGIVVESTSRWMRHGAPTLSAAMAFYALTSIAPLLVIAVSVAGVILGREAVRAELVAEVERAVGPGVAELVDQLTRVEWLGQPGLLTGGLSLAVFLFASTVAMEHLRDSLNRVWEVPAEKGRLLLSLFRGRILSFALVLLVGLVLLASLLLRLVVSTLDQVVGRWLPFDFVLFRVGELGSSILGLTIMFALMFRFLPDIRTPWRHVWVGAAVTGLLFLGGEMLIGAYLGYVGVASPYGAVGSIVVLLFWIYYSSMVLLWGAELTATYSQLSSGAAVTPGEGPPPSTEGRPLPPPKAE